VWTGRRVKDPLREDGEKAGRDSGIQVFGEQSLEVGW
jgi:hypothetical protein